MSLNQNTSTVDMSPEAILSRLKMVDELNQLCKALSETNLPGNQADAMVAESPAVNQNLGNDFQQIQTEVDAQ
jgi:hypothetical protein